MYELIMNWLGIPSDVFPSDDIKVLAVFLGGYLILSFILDIFKMIWYSISRR